MNDSQIVQEITKEIEVLLPSISVDCVILGYNGTELQVLINNWKDFTFQTIPGGFVRQSENLETAAQRVLKSRTGQTYPFLIELGVFSETNRRDIDALLNELDKLTFMTQQIKDWFSQRFISVAYLALVNSSDYSQQSDFLNRRCEWVTLNDLPMLGFDHNKMIHRAIQHLQNQIYYTPLCKHLLPEKFTMKTLRTLYEIILDQPLDRGNFQKRILRSNMLIRLEKEMTGAANKAPYLYRFA